MEGNGGFSISVLLCFACMANCNIYIRVGTDNHESVGILIIIAQEETNKRETYGMVQSQETPLLNLHSISSISNFETLALQTSSPSSTLLRIPRLKVLIVSSFAFMNAESLSLSLSKIGGFRVAVHPVLLLDVIRMERMVLKSKSGVPLTRRKVPLCAFNLKFASTCSAP